MERLGHDPNKVNYTLNLSTVEKEHLKPLGDSFTETKTNFFS